MTANLSSTARPDAHRSKLDGPAHLHGALDQARQALVDHRLCRMLCSPQAWRTFMAHHVFAVWDFMSLAKRLQHELTCVQIPWLPPSDPQASRFINSVILSEESDDDGAGGCSSHFALYLAAMAECGADPRPAQTFVEHVRHGKDLGMALKSAGAPAGVEPFVRSTLQLAAHGRTEEVAAVFFYGREQVIPDMFGGLLRSLAESGHPAPKLRYYLDRHVALDGDEHGPMARDMMDKLCGEDVEAHRRAMAAGLACLGERAKLWDAICAAVEHDVAAAS